MPLSLVLVCALLVGLALLCLVGGVSLTLVSALDSNGRDSAPAWAGTLIASGLGLSIWGFYRRSYPLVVVGAAPGLGVCSWLAITSEGEFLAAAAWTWFLMLILLTRVGTWRRWFAQEWELPD